MLWFVWGTAVNWWNPEHVSLNSLLLQMRKMISVLTAQCGSALVGWCRYISDEGCREGGT